MNDFLTEQEFRAELHRRCKAAGGIAVWSDAHNFSATYTSNIIHGRRPASKRVLDALGMDRLTMYRCRGP